MSKVYFGVLHCIAMVRVFCILHGVTGMMYCRGEDLINGYDRIMRRQYKTCAGIDAVSRWVWS